MTTRHYRIVGGTAFEREGVIAAAPPGCEHDDQAQRAATVLLVPLPGLVGTGQNDMLSVLADVRKHDPLVIVLIGIELLPGFRHWARAMSGVAPAAIGVVRGGEASLQGEEAAALLAGQVACIAASHVASSDPAVRAGSLSFAAAVQDARGALTALIDRIAAVAPVHAVFVATIGREPATFARLLRDHHEVDETQFLQGIFDDLPEGRAGGHWTDVPWRATLAGAALPLLILAGLAAFFVKDIATSNHISGAALAVTRAVQADRPAAYRLLAAALDRAGDRSRAGAASARAVASSGAVHTAVPPPPPTSPASVLPAETEPEPATRLSYAPPPELYGALPDAYLKVLLPACENAVGTRYPFVAGVAEEVAAGPFRLAFAPGGVFDSFVKKRLAEHIDRSGPVWRWRAGDSAVAAFDPDTPDTMARALALGRLAQQGARYSVSLTAVDGDVDEAEITTSGGSVTLKPGGGPQMLRWSLQDQPGEIALRLMSGGRVVQRIAAGSRWGPVRLADQGRSASASGILFGDGLHSATVRFSSDQPIFGRGGLWSFRCPAAL